MEKSKSSAKGAGKLPHGSEQSRSSTNIQKGQEENIQQPKSSEQLKQKQQQGKQGKKTSR